MAINVKGGFFAAKFAVPHMKKAGSGSDLSYRLGLGPEGIAIESLLFFSQGGAIPLTLSLAANLGPPQHTNKLYFARANAHSDVTRIFSIEPGVRRMES